MIIAGLGSFGIAKAATSGDVVINEIAWMGNTNSPDNEWIELKNTTNQSIALSGWTLASPDKKIHLVLKGNIGADGFYLLERTHNNSLPNIIADETYKGDLPNSGEDLILKDNSGTTIDEANYLSGWPAGNNLTKQTMERTADGNWQTSLNPDGTPRAENSKLQATNPKQSPITKIQNPKPKKTAVVLPKNKKADTTNTINQDLAAAGIGAAPSDQNSTNPWILFVIVLAVIMGAGILLVALKLKYKPKE